MQKYPMICLYFLFVALTDLCKETNSNNIAFVKLELFKSNEKDSFLINETPLVNKNRLLSKAKNSNNNITNTVNVPLSNKELNSTNKNLNLLNKKIATFNEIIKVFEKEIPLQETKPIIFDFEKLLHNGTFYRIFQYNKSKSYIFNLIYSFCDNKFYEISKTIKLTLKIHFLNSKIQLLKNHLSLTKYEIFDYNSVLNKIMEYLDDICKLSNYNYEIKEEFILLLKKFERAKSTIKKNYFEKEILYMSSLIKKDEEKIDDEISNLSSGNSDECIDILHNEASMLDINFGSGLDKKTDNISDFSNVDSNVLSLKEHLEKEKNISESQHSLSFEIIENSNENNINCDKKELSKLHKSKLDSCKELLIATINTQKDMISLLKKYKDYIIENIDDAYNLELYLLNKKMRKDRVGNFKKTQEFFTESKQEIKTKISIIFDFLENDLSRSLLC